jgi:UMF1 family MFS transporter
LALVLAGLANVGFEIATIFNNAMLPEIAPPGKIGRISGWAWGLGYGGGLACLIVILALFDTSSLDEVRATSLLVAAWFAVFTIPLWLWTPDMPATGIPFGRAVRDGLVMLWGTLRHIGRTRNIALYLLAHMIYGDGLATLFAMGGVFAQGAFGMTTAEVLQFAVALNVTAGLGAAAFGWVDDRIGPKRTILISLAGLIVTGAVVLGLHDKLAFLIAGSVLGIFIGPAQAASRSLLARLVPEGQETEMFGLYAFSDKATSFIGPATFGIALDLTGSARAGMATILVFFLVGAALLAAVKEHG